MPMRLTTATVLFAATSLTLSAQTPLTLDSCRALALRNNKKIEIARTQEAVARDMRCAAATASLPRIDIEATYLHTPHKTSLLGSYEKDVARSLGSTIEESLGILFPQLPANILTEPLNTIGSSIADALTLDTRNIFVAALTVTQPLYTGGRTRAYKRLARLAQSVAANNSDATRQETIDATDRAYWLVVSLTHKERLATSYVALTHELYGNVEKLKQQGMATTADLLRVNVKLNEAETAHLRASDALSLARMALCYICGLPLDSNPTLAHDSINPATLVTEMPVTENSIANRPELKNLRIACEASHYQTNLTRSGYLPQIALTAGYTVSNPNIVNGFRRTFDGMWNIGAIIKIPLWNWGEGKYRIRAAKAGEKIARYTLYEAQEAMELQLRQSQQQLREAHEHYRMAMGNIKTANENLRNANIAFSEGMYTSEELMQAQTAWLQAESTLIDAQIGIMLARTQLLRASGNLQAE